MKISKQKRQGTGALWMLAGAGVSLAMVHGALGEALPQHRPPAAKAGGVVVQMCDGKTSVEVKDLKPGQAMPRDKAQGVADQLMTEWRRKNKDARWDEVTAQNTPRPGNGATAPATAPAPVGTAGARPSGAAAQGQAGAPTRSLDTTSQRGIYGGYDTRDEMVWAAETKKFIEEGNAIFHDDKKLGGTIGVTCDMCHPNAANTHPETYPKYQVQLQRVALLRDMINWCIENPVKGKPMPDDDRRLRAMEAYILSQRKGTKLDFGKH